jgi:hypothetical protein
LPQRWKEDKKAMPLSMTKKHGPSKKKIPICSSIRDTRSGDWGARICLTSPPQKIYERTIRNRNLNRTLHVLNARCLHHLGQVLIITITSTATLPSFWCQLCSIMNEQYPTAVVLLPFHSLS